MDQLSFRYLYTEDTREQRPTVCIDVDPKRTTCVCLQLGPNGLRTLIRERQELALARECKTDNGAYTVETALPTLLRIAQNKGGSRDALRILNALVTRDIAGLSKITFTNEEDSTMIDNQGAPAATDETPPTPAPRKRASRAKPKPAAPEADAPESTTTATAVDDSTTETTEETKVTKPKTKSKKAVKAVKTKKSAPKKAAKKVAKTKSTAKTSKAPRVTKKSVVMDFIKSKLMEYTPSERKALPRGARNEICTAASKKVGWASAAACSAEFAAVVKEITK